MIKQMELILFLKIFIIPLKFLICKRNQICLSKNSQKRRKSLKESVEFSKRAKLQQLWERVVLEKLLYWTFCHAESTLMKEENDMQTILIQLSIFWRFCKLCHADWCFNANFDCQVNFGICCQTQIRFTRSRKKIKSSYFDKLNETLKMHWYFDWWSNCERNFRRLKKEGFNCIWAHVWSSSRIFRWTNFRFGFINFLHYLLIT